MPKVWAAAFSLGFWLGSAGLTAAPPVWETGAGFRVQRLDVPESGRTGFTVVPSLAAGLQFTNHLRGQEAAYNNNLMNGSGVAAGDFDGDGWCDLYFCAISGANALYRNLGNWRFEDVTASAGVGCPNVHSTGALFADLDGDGKLDLLVATLGQGVRCLVNEGGGKFRESTAAAGLASETGSTSLAMADVDGDGDLDLYVANYGALSILRSGGRAEAKLVNGQWVFSGPYAKRLRLVEGRLEEVGEPDVLYLNDGRGHFQPVPWNSDYFLDEEGQPKPEPWDFGLTVQMRDLNGDRAPEIYVCNDFQTVDRMWINNGRGHFRAVPRLVMRKQSFSSMGVDFGDLDRDGRLDFFVTEMLSRDHKLRLRQVVGMQPLTPYPGRLENRPEVPRNTLFLGRGDGTYAEIAHYSGVAASDWSWQPVFLDVDLDGYEDILIGNGMMFDVQDRDVLNYVRSLGQQTPEAARTNLFLYPPFLTPNLALRNRHDLTFEDVSRAWGFASTQVSQGLALADLDHDGDLDVVVNCLNASPLLCRNDTSAPRVAVRLRGQSPNECGIGAVIRVRGGPVGLQKQEVLCGGHYLSGDEPLLTFAAGTITNELAIEVRWRSGRNSLVRQARPNHLYEIAEAHATPSAPEPAPAKAQPWFKDLTPSLGHTHYEKLFNDFARQPLLMKLLSQFGPGVAWLDLDQDGQDELVLGNGRGGTLQVFHRAATGTFEAVNLAPAWTAPDDLAGLAAWCSTNGLPVLLAGLASYESGNTNGPAVIACAWPARADGTGQGQLTLLGEVCLEGASAGPLAVADMDGDGDLDLFVGGRVIPGAYPEAAPSRVFRQEQGRLVLDRENSSVLAKAGLVSSAVWSELNGDGYPELALACEWGSIRIFQNHRGRLAECDVPLVWTSASTAEREGPRSSAPPGASALRLSQLLGWWNSLTTGDLDEDGRQDLIVGNWGLNTGYEANSAHPLRLYYGNLGGLGVIDLIETYYAPDAGAEVPRRTLGALSQAFPMLAEHYPTHRAFSATTAADLLRLLPARPAVVSATTLSSMLFLNRGSNFVAVPLPPEAQFAPVFAVNVADADGDGHEDVFLGQNFFAMRPELCRLDGGRGLWLRGDGRGGLVPVPGQDSGVMVYGEQRGAAVGDFDRDGRADLVVTQNGAATRLFQNVTARPGLRVRLQGPPANPWGIGAVVRLDFGARSGPAREIHAGAGYWSQDSLVPVLGCPDPPARLEVLWPGGKRQVYDLPGSLGEVVVDPEGKVQSRPPNP
jgi:hypothetical protein